MAERSMKNKTKKPEYRIIWRDANRKFAKAPKGRVPKGWKKYRIPIVRRALTETEKRIRQDEKTQKAFARRLQKGVERVKITRLSVSEERHLRFRRIGATQWSKTKPRLRTKVQIAVFEGNKFISYWKNTYAQAWTKELSKAAKQDVEKIRFPENKRIEFPLIGKTWKEALEIVSINGLRYNCKLFYEMRFSGRIGSERVKFYHRSFISFREMYGKTYDDYLIEQLSKVILAWCNDRNYLFTSREKIEEFGVDNYQATGESFWLDWMEDKLENFSSLTDVRGTFVGYIA